MNRDWIKVVRAGYRLGGSDADWLDGLLGRVAPLIDHGIPPVAWLHQDTPKSIRRTRFATSAAPEVRRWVRLSHWGSDPRLYQMLYRDGRCLGTARRDMFPCLPDEQPKFRVITAGRMHDLLLAAGHTGTGDTVAFAAYSVGPIALHPAQQRRWRLIGAHLGAALRLRSVMAGKSLDTGPVEAVLRPDGRLLDARGAAWDGDMLERLRRTARLIEGIRCDARRLTAEETLAAWEALVAGRWSLIEHIDSDERRFLVAVRNDLDYPDPRGLSQRERQVAEYIGMGRSTGEVAYTLGLARSCVTDSSAGAQRKLGLGSRAELAAFFARNGPRARLAEVAVCGERLLFGAYPALAEELIAPLTGAERAVLAALLAGSTTSDIALRRGARERTVANQVQAIYRKLGVRSRSELAARLYGGGRER